MVAQALWSLVVALLNLPKIKLAVLSSSSMQIGPMQSQLVHAYIMNVGQGMK